MTKQTVGFNWGAAASGKSLLLLLPRFVCVCLGVWMCVCSMSLCARIAVCVCEYACTFVVVCLCARAIRSVFVCTYGSYRTRERVAIHVYVRVCTSVSKREGVRVCV